MSFSHHFIDVFIKAYIGISFTSLIQLQVFFCMSLNHVALHSITSVDPPPTKPLEIQVFRGHPAPRGRTAPIF